jgi:PAS domain-containing protein
MNQHVWIEESPAAVTVCDRAGIIIEVNARARRTFGPEKQLVGSNVLDCHPEPARSKLKELLASGATNVYTIEKNGVKKLIYQAPWYQDGTPAGMVELSLEIPFDLPHFVRGDGDSGETMRSAT